MARLLARVQTEVGIDHRSFDLLDDGGPQEVVPDFGDPSRWLFTGRNSVTVVTQDGHSESADVTVESWDAEPPPVPDGHETGQALLVLDSGLVEINPLVDPEAPCLDLHSPGIYHLRALAAPGTYTFQFWPS